MDSDCNSLRRLGAGVKNFIFPDLCACWGTQMGADMKYHMDGRKCCPILYRMFEQQSKITSLAQLDIYVTESIMDKPGIACFAPLAQQAARKGEEAAQEILEECADALLALVRDTFRKASDVSGKPRNLYLWGSVLTQNKEIEMRLRKKCKEAFPALKVDFPGISALELALSLASGTW